MYKRLWLIEEPIEGKRIPISLFVGASMIFPAYFASDYLSTSLGKLTKLENVNEIFQYPPSQYYKIKNYYIDTNNTGIYSYQQVGERKNQSINYFSMGITAPICIDNKAGASQFANIWLANEYEITNNRDLTDNERDTILNHFLEQKKKRFFKSDFHNISYFKFNKSVKEYDKVFLAASRSEKFKAGNIVFLSPVYEPFDSRNGQNLVWAIGVYFGGFIAVFIALLFVKLNEENLDDFENGIDFYDHFSFNLFEKLSK